MRGLRFAQDVALFISILRGYCQLRPPPKSTSATMCCRSCGRTVWAVMGLAADQWPAARPEKRGHQPPGRGARQQREQLSVSPAIGERVRDADASDRRAPPGTNRHHQDLDRPGRRLAGFARQRSGPAAVESEAVAMVEALRTGDLRGFMKSVAEDPKLLNARGPEGSTPFMYAVLYTGQRRWNVC